MDGNELAASFNWNDSQLTQLSFSRNDKPIVFTEHEIDLTFKDPRGNGEIEKILLDPQYRPGNASNADFWVETTITSPVSNKKVSETALCYWNNDKSIAVGTIEDDGGRLAIVTESVTDSLKTSKFAFLVVPVSGYSGFRIAEDVPVGNESPGLIGIEAKLKSAMPVLSEISFPPILARGSTGSVVSALQKALKAFRVQTLRPILGPSMATSARRLNRRCAPINRNKTLQSMGSLGIRPGGSRQEQPVPR